VYNDDSSLRHVKVCTPTGKLANYVSVAACQRLFRWMHN